MEDSTAFFRHYAIDPDESPCGKTSRIVQAHATVQLFAQRILLNLEPFTFVQAEAEAWRWRQHYRVWEAARKVGIQGQQLVIDPDGPLAEASWANQRLGRATQALPVGNLKRIKTTSGVPNL